MSDFRFRFNGHDLSDWIRVNPTRSIAPRITAETVEVPGKPGTTFVRTHVEPLEIPVHMRLRLEGADADEVASKRHMLAAIFASGEPAELALPDEPTRYYKALLTEPDALSALWATGTCDATFTAYDPIAYGHGRAMMLDGETTMVAPGGNFETRPTITVRAAGGPLTVTLEETGELVKLVEDPGEGDEVAFDMEARIVVKNGVYAPVDLDSDFFALRPGVNHIRVQGATEGAVQWTERWQ